MKGRAKGAETVTKNEILTGVNRPGDFIPALVEVNCDVAAMSGYMVRPFTQEPGCGATGAVRNVGELLARGDDRLSNPSPANAGRGASRAGALAREEAEL